MMTDTYTEPEHTCSLCPRLVNFRESNKRELTGYHNAPVNNIGDVSGTVLILGLAPGLQGANKSGLPFIGDHSGDILYKSLGKMGLAKGDHHNIISSQFKLTGVLISNAVRCVPPENKPLANEIHNCRPFLLSLIESMVNLKAIFALGKVAHDTVLKTFGKTLAANKFVHRSTHILTPKIHLVDSYHCSRYNLNTKVLTEEMFVSALTTAISLSE